MQFGLRQFCSEDNSLESTYSLKIKNIFLGRFFFLGLVYKKLRCKREPFWFSEILRYRQKRLTTLYDRIKSTDYTIIK